MCRQVIQCFVFLFEPNDVIFVDADFCIQVENHGFQEEIEAKLV